MAVVLFASIALALLASSGVGAQYFPPTPENVIKVYSKIYPGVSISYKEPGICETTPGVKSYAGHVTLPPGVLADVGLEQNFTINAFFWFFEARTGAVDAPLSIWMNGGPGSSSMVGLFAENGPCFVNDDSNSTTLNPWSWNNEVNMLYIDQPVQTGFSYDYPTNVTSDLTSFLDGLKAADFSEGVPKQNHSFLVGTLSSQNPVFTLNSTENAARATWHFAQTFFAEFPHYKPNNDKVSIWTESYGGKYGPAFTSFFDTQNSKISDGSLDAYYIHLDTLGIINGYSDMLLQTLAYAEFAYNNTYGIQLLSKEVYEQAIHDLQVPGGCLDQQIECHRIEKELDPLGFGNVDRVNEICLAASENCTEAPINAALLEAGRGVYDIGHPDADPFPPKSHYGFLNQPWVLSALGSPVNFTSFAPPINDDFVRTGDFARGNTMNHLAKVLDHGVKVTLVYGDRDYICNWVGGEIVSTSIPGHEGLSDAGYAPIITNATYIGGAVRQVGNLSFSRVFQAGHMVPAYQPETAYSIFMRAMFDKDISTGLIPLFDEYATIGPSSTFHIKNDPPPFPDPVCYTLALLESCDFEDYWAVVNGTAIIKDYVVIGIEEEQVGSLGVGFGDSGVQQVLGEVVDLSVDEIMTGREEARAKAYADWKTGSRAARKTRMMPPF